jgi:hypothetical protein
MAQRGSTSKPTRFKGPTVITLRGAGSTGTDPLTKGAGLDIGLDIQVPVAQTANALQITKPDGTVIWAIGPGGNIFLKTITASGAIPVRPSAAYVITLASAAALTLAAPTAGVDDGVEIKITSATAFAHVLTATGLLQTGSASANVATFAAFAGAGLTLVAFNGKWQVLAQLGISFT